MSRKERNLLTFEPMPYVSCVVGYWRLNKEGPQG